MLSDRLKGKGFKVSGASSLVARGRTMTIHINPSGHCWSSSDVGDVIIPIIPEILEIPKQEVPLQELLSKYCRVKKSGDSAVVGTSTRLESGNDWRALRKIGQCALTPDEWAVISLMLETASGGCTLVTDFPTKTSRVRIMGKRLYHESVLRPKQAVTTLRSVDRKGSRNSYLTEDGLLVLNSFRPPSRARQKEVLEGLGQWCYFAPD